ncbi:hypothetical protein KXV43_005565 [Aspergillus fumigatus]|nr:hypothetical protein KXV43_005565 [Aspergillus fumigatus]
MASRAFSSTARQLKQLTWTLHGTTVDEATFKPVKLPPMPGAPVIPPEGVATGKSDSTTLPNQSTSEKGKKW